MEKEQSLRYSKHILIKDIGETGQARIQKNRILVIGCGGLGNTVISLLAGAGVGHLTIVDDDRIELSNLHRQIHFTSAHIGLLKAEVLAQFIKQKNETVSVKPILCRLDESELLQQCFCHDIIVDCSDNYETRKALSKASVTSRIPMIFGSVIGTEGHITVFNPQDENSPCYSCIYSTKENQDEKLTAYGVFSPLVTIIGAMQAAEVLKHIVGAPHSLVGTLLTYDTSCAQLYPISLKRNSHCPVCGRS